MTQPTYKSIRFWNDWQYLPIASAKVWEKPIAPNVSSTPWIYHNLTKWLISISADWYKWITLSDKNLWATVVYNNWDEMSSNNVWDYYQWWNNYWFPMSSTLNTSGTQVDASSYWPGNYYNSNWVFNTNYRWDSSNNQNLWWSISNTVEAMQWPCPIWFHVSTKQEREDLIFMIVTWFKLSRTHNTLKTYLKMPCQWRILYDGRRADFGWWYWYYWTATADTSQYKFDYSFYCYFGSNTINLTSSHTSYWFLVRPVKNIPVIPDNTWTKLY